MFKKENQDFNLIEKLIGKCTISYTEIFEFSYSLCHNMLYFYL